MILFSLLVIKNNIIKNKFYYLNDFSIKILCFYEMIKNNKNTSLNKDKSEI